MECYEMKRIMSLSVMVLCLAVTSARAADQVLTFGGMGAVRIGMTVAETEKGLGTKLKSLYPATSDACWFGGRADGIDAQVSYMIQNGKIVRIDVDDHAVGVAESVVPPVVTERGIHIGSSRSDVKKAYGARLIINFHPQGNAAMRITSTWRCPA
jgi:hypothetical protein